MQRVKSKYVAKPTWAGVFLNASTPNAKKQVRRGLRIRATRHRERFANSIRRLPRAGDLKCSLMTYSLVSERRSRRIGKPLIGPRRRDFGSMKTALSVNRSTR